MHGTIYIVRHGQDEDNATDVLNGRRDTPLTELGRKQAVQVAAKLASYNISAVYSSPLKRAYETAKIIAQKSTVDNVAVDLDLIERDFGSMTGKPVADILKYSTNYIQADKTIHFLDADGAESMVDVLARAARVLTKLQQSQESNNIVIVTHGDTGKMLITAYYNWSWRKGLQTPFFGNTEIIKLV
jgi:broad specificity phosphatase PhoE